MTVRLNRYLSMCGIASRREADQLIKKGRVKINGLIVRELGYAVDTEKDRVEILGRVVRPEKKRYIILNKPRLYLTALGNDRRGKRTIEELINDIPERLYPVGRLDYDTEGLLILTNDGDLSHRILHPRYKLSKVYEALVKGIVVEKTLERMAKGTLLEDGETVPDFVGIKKYKEENTILRVAFHEGRKHIVKRFMADFGHPVLRLRRTAVGPLKLGLLPSGSWRNMTGKELDEIKRAAGLGDQEL